jgi:hypothetical protein
MTTGRLCRIQDSTIDKMKKYGLPNDTPNQLILKLIDIIETKNGYVSKS